MTIEITQNTDNVKPVFGRNLAYAIYENIA